MTATILLVRHAAHSDLGRILSGRVGEVPLSVAGRAQASRLAAHLDGEPLHSIHTSPVLRAQETAQAIARRRRIAVDIAEPLDEIDFGEWSGKGFAELEQDLRWRDWNARRGDAATPAGDTMAAVQQRILDHLRRAASAASGLIVAMVTHADVIRAAVAGILGLSLNRILSFDVDAASVTRIAAGSWGERLISLNERVV
ncbi:histidine phosphatase family protein [Erythrobacter sp.]|uniref:histidine phosphatase family protein n=1 Tax=Erythrobacter sp. TaxID=1042 RepID=UPI0025D08C85|nr:histidine phosphatase family protein [Erythrobacter sp.]